MEPPPRERQMADLRQQSSPKIVVAVILNRLYEWSQNFITRELVELTRQGVAVHVCARQVVPRDDLTQEESQLLANYIALPENPFTPAVFWKVLRLKLSYPRRFLRAWLAFFALGHRKPAKIGRSVVCFFRAIAVLQTIENRGINLIHGHFMTAPTETALYLSILSEIPFGCTGHAMDLHQDSSGLRKKALEATYIATCTAANAQFLQEENLAPRPKVHVIYHGIDLPDRTSTVTRSGHEFTFLAVGRLSPKKGFAILLDACHLLRQKGFRFQCRIIGQGPLEQKLRQKIQTFGLSDCAEMRGFVPPNKMRGVYESSDALVVPSILMPDGDRDGLPNVCLEAMSYGLPIIGSQVSGIPEGVIHGENGFLVQPDDAPGLSDAMAALMQSEDLQRMRTASYRIANEKFSIGQNVKQLRLLMEAVV